MQTSGHAAGTVSSTDLSTLPTYAEAEVRGVYNPMLPSQVSSSLSARLNLVPRMESCKFLELIDEIVQPLAVLALEGVQFGQARLYRYSQSV